MNKKRILAAMMSVILLASLSGCAKVDEPDTDPKTSHSSASNKSDNDSKSENKSDDKSETESKDNTSKDNESRDNESKPATSGSTNNNLGNSSSDTSSNTSSVASSDTNEENLNPADKVYGPTSLEIKKRNEAYVELERYVFYNYFHPTDEDGNPTDASKAFFYMLNDKNVTYDEVKALAPNMDEIWYKMAYVMIRSYVYCGVKESLHFDPEKTHFPYAASYGIKEIDKDAIGKMFGIDTNKLVDFSVWVSHEQREPNKIASDNTFEIRTGILEAESETAAAEMATIIDNIGSQYVHHVAKQKGTTVYFAIYRISYKDIVGIDPTPFFEEVV